MMRSWSRPRAYARAGVSRRELSLAGSNLARRHCALGRTRPALLGPQTTPTLALARFVGQKRCVRRARTFTSGDTCSRYARSLECLLREISSRPGGRTAVGYGVLLTSAAVLDQVLYETFVVPRLSEWQAVPMAWWLFVTSPILVTALAVGFYSANLKQLIAASAVAAILTASFHAWAANTGRPGHFKSFAIEAPIVFWLLTPLLSLIFFSVLMSAGHYFSWLIRRMRQPHGEAA